MRLARSLLTLSLIASTLTIGSVVGATSASAATLEVCATGGTHTTIQAAVDAATSGDTINVCAGTYAENVIINKNITLLGPNSAISPNSADPLVSNTSRVAEAIVSPNADVSGNAKAFTLTGASTTDVTINGFRVVLPGTLPSALSRWSPSDGHQYFVYMSNVPLTELTLEKNMFTGGKGAEIGSFALNFATAGSARLVLGDNRIFSGPESNGVWVNNTATDSRVELAVSNNVWLNNRGFAMNITGAATKFGTISDNWIGNSTTGLAGVNGFLLRQSGIVLSGAFDGLSVSDNSFTNGESHAISLWSNISGAISVTGNQITGYNNTSTTGAITGRAVTAGTTQNFTEVVISGNIFSNRVGSSRAVSIIATGHTLTATNNWWGQASGPDSGQIYSVVSSQVVSDPWCTTDTCPTIWHVASSGNDANAGTTEAPFRNVQTAINAASAGDTITVSAGTYTGNLSINKALTILGPNNSIAPGTGATRQSEAVVSGAVTIDSAIDGLTLKGFKITSPDTSTVGVTIGSNSKNVTISYNDISGFNQGILSQGNSLNFGSDMNISYNYLHGLSPDATYGSYGIHLRNVKALTVSNNIITDTVAGLTGTQYRRGMGLRGIQNAVVENNTVNFGSTASAQATYAIFVTQKLNDGGNGNDLAVSDVVISGNTLSGVVWGIDLSMLDSQASGIVVKENTVRKVFTGVNFRSYGQTGDTVVDELTVQQNNFSEIQSSGALAAAGVLSAGVQIFSFDASAPATNEFDGILVQQNLLPSRKVNELGQINSINVGAIRNPATFTFWPTIINNLNAPGNYWGSASGPATVGSPTSGGGASIKLSPYITAYTANPSKDGQPGFWPTSIISSDDATLSRLTLSRGTLSPIFASGTTTYTASVASTVATGYSITATKRASNATVVQYLGETGTVTFTGALSVGANIIRTVVTSSDSTTIQTYTVTVTRALTTQRISAVIPSPMTVSSVNKTYALSATSSSGNAVTFTTSSASTICEISGTTLTVKPGGGTCVIRASVEGNDTYAAAVLDVTRVITTP